MKSVEQMKLEANKYLIYLDTNEDQAYLVKHSGYVEISSQRALEWVEAGIKDLDCRSKEKMIDILKGWLK